MSSVLPAPGGVWVAQTASTNTLAWAMLADGTLQSGQLLGAQAQWAGRGQHGRSWVATPGQNLTFSLVWDPQGLPPAHAFALTGATATALHAVLAPLLPAHALWLKWPNDLYLGGHKLAGTLIESQSAHGRLSAAVVGVGLNVNQRHFPPGLDRPATSLALATGHTWAPMPLLAALQRALLKALGALRSPGQQAHWLTAYRAALLGRGLWWQATLHGQPTRLRLLDVAANGTLSVQLQPGGPPVSGLGTGQVRLGHLLGR